jgi:hypothetical protein
MPTTSLEKGDKRMNVNLDLGAVLKGGQPTFHGNQTELLTGVGSTNGSTSSRPITAALHSRPSLLLIGPSVPCCGVSMFDPPMKNQFLVPDEMGTNSPFRRYIAEDDGLIIYCNGGDSI